MIVYDKQVFGDFVEVGNGNMGCPSATDPADPLGQEPILNCSAAQAGAPPNATSGNDAYFMRWADTDADPATFNSSTASVTVPPGARVDYARLNWAGNTESVRVDGSVPAEAGCDPREYERPQPGTPTPCRTASRSTTWPRPT